MKLTSRHLAVLAVLALGVSLAAFAGQDILLPSAARTASVSSSDILKGNTKCAHFVMAISAISGTTVTPTIEGKDALGTYYPILAGASAVSTGTTVMKVCPGIGTVINGSTSDMLPDVYRFSVSQSGVSATYSVTENTSN